MTTATSEIEFELERFVPDDGRLVLEGRWYGVTGRRFVRPVLVIGGRRHLALLDDKPWPADEGAGWRATFDCLGTEEGPARLQVAPDVAVELPPPGRRPRRDRLPARVPRPVVQDLTGRFARAEAERPEAERPAAERPAAKRPAAERLAAGAAPAAGAADLPRLTAERDALREERNRLLAARDRAREERDRMEADLAAVTAERDGLKVELAAARAAAEQAQAEIAGARTGRRRAVEERDAALEQFARLQRTAAAPAVVAVRRSPRSILRRSEERREVSPLARAGALGALLCVALYVAVAIF